MSTYQQKYIYVTADNIVGSVNISLRHGEAMEAGLETATDMAADQEGHYAITYVVPAEIAVLVAKQMLKHSEVVD